jgi:hypothetical protein
MAVVEFEQGTLSIDATVIGRGLNVEPSLVQGQMREGKITVVCERGVNEDVGRMFKLVSARRRTISSEHSALTDAQTILVQR